MRCDIEGDGSHYWLALDDGQEIDITADQFGGKEVRLGSAIVPREKVLESANTASRYRILLEKVREVLENLSESFPTDNLPERD